MKFDMVFEGGGAKGMVFIGAVQSFSRHGHECGRLLGTSAGAITATLLSVGYTADEMLGALGETDAAGHPIFATFMGEPKDFSPEVCDNSLLTSLFKRIDLPLPASIETRVENYIVAKLLENKRFRHLFSLVEHGGWYSADAFVEWFKGKLDSGQHEGKPRAYSHMTLAELHEATGRHLTLIAADISGGQILVLNHVTAPRCPVVWAVRMSMSVPLLWQEVVWRPEWGNYRGRDINNHLVVDGGLLSNFPIELFLSNQAAVLKIMGESDSDHVLGCLIDEKIAIPEAPAKAVAGPGGPDMTGVPVVNRLLMMMDTVTSAHDKMVIEGVEHLVVRLPAKGYGTTEFDMDVPRREALIAAGDREMERFLKRLDAAALSFSTQPSFDQDRVEAQCARILDFD